MAQLPSDAAHKPALQVLVKASGSYPSCALLVAPRVREQVVAVIGYKSDITRTEAVDPDSNSPGS